MFEAITITLLGEPRGKGRPRFSRRSGHAYTPAETRSYEGALRYAAQEAMKGRVPLEGPLDVAVYARFSVPQSWSKRMRAQALCGVIRPAKRPDWENIAKMLDAFNEVVWRDDAQIVDGTIRKEYSERPALVVVVKPVQRPALAIPRDPVAPPLLTEAAA